MRDPRNTMCSLLVAGVLLGWFLGMVSCSHPMTDLLAIPREQDSTLACHRNLYSYKVTQADSQGRICWDTIQVMSCYGRCDSNEISDWRFPYKRSYHPVCLYGAREVKTTILKHCEEGAEPGTELHRYLNAITCKCHVCKSSEASCEGLGGHLTPGSETWRQAELREMERLR